jgi:alpha-glucosidase
LIYWMDKGVDGFRIDAVPCLFEKLNPDGSFPDEPRTFDPNCDRYDDCSLQHIYVQDQDETFDMVYQWRKLVDEYTKTRKIESKVLMTESYASIDLIQRFYGNGSMEGAQVPFNFELIKKVNKKSSAEDYKNAVEGWLVSMPEGKMANWVVSAEYSVSHFFLSF